MEELSEEEIRVLANAFPDGGSARHLLLRAGPPAGQHPSWQARDAEGFWQAVSELFANGKLPGGRRRLLTAANQTLPGNGTFSAGAGAGVRGGPDWPSRPPVPSPRPASPPPNRAPSKDAPETARRRRRFAGLVAGALAIVILAVVGGVYGMIAIGQHYYQKVGDVAEPPRNFGLHSSNSSDSPQPVIAEQATGPGPWIITGLGFRYEITKAVLAPNPSHAADSAGTLTISGFVTRTADMPFADMRYEVRDQDGFRLNDPEANSLNQRGQWDSFPTLDQRYPIAIVIGLPASANASVTVTLTITDPFRGGSALLLKDIPVTSG